MPRISRAVAEGMPYHVTQRGNRRENVFHEDEDRQKYLEWFHKYSKENGLKIWAYCLMTNHVHLVVVPECVDSLEKTLRPLHMRYAQYMNRKKSWSGHLWQGRFFSSVLDERYLRAAVKYVEKNPVRAGMVKMAEEYRWSSAAAHCGKREDEILSADIHLLQETPDWAWSKWLQEPEREEENNILRRNAQKGLPCGSELFIAELEKRLERSLSFRPQGRPRKEEVGEEGK